MRLVEKHYNKLAGIYDIRWKKYNNKTAEEIIKNIDIKNSLKILDAGCGTGVLIHKLLEKNSKVNITGIDISEEMLKIAKYKFNKNVKLINSDVEDLKLKNKFDLIIFNSNTHYLNDLNKVIKDFKKLLNENGKLILVDWSKDSILFKILNLYWKLKIKSFKRIYTTNRVKEILTNNGFKIEKAYNFKIDSWKLYLIKAKV